MSRKRLGKRERQQLKSERDKTANGDSLNLRNRREEKISTSQNPKIRRP